jgi:RNA polymerase sigma-70 factor (ECF subfamily)
MEDDTLIIKELRAGSRKAFEQLVHSFQNLVFKTCLSFLNQQEDAEDVAQEVFMDAYRTVNSFRGDSSIATWLYRLSVNKSLDFIRAKKRKKRGGGQLHLAANDELAQLHVADWNDPHKTLEDTERKQLLLAAIDKLPERQKVAITLSKLEGLTQEQIAEVMETSVSSVESLLVRAKRKMKEQLYSFFYEINKEMVQEKQKMSVK